MSANTVCVAKFGAVLVSAHLQVSVVPKRSWILFHISSTNFSYLLYVATLLYSCKQGFQLCSHFYELHLRNGKFCLSFFKFFLGHHCTMIPCTSFIFGFCQHRFANFRCILHLCCESKFSLRFSFLGNFATFSLCSFNFSFGGFLFFNERGQYV